MPAYLVVDISVNDWEPFREYVRLAPPIEEQGGAWLVKGVAGEALEGDWRPERFSLAQFPSAQHVKDYLGSAAYAAARQLREGAAVTRMAVVAGAEPPAGSGGYIVVDVDVTDPDLYRTYVPLVGPSVAAYGGVGFVRGENLVVLEGDWPISRLIVLAFPSVEQARDWWASDEYREAKAIRQQAARTDMVVVEGAT
jgi:uncharacterized protein (DUF1330 family)